MEIKGHNSDNNLWILSLVFNDYIPVYEIWTQYTNAFKDIAENYFLTELKGHNSDNNWWILFLIELDLYFMIIYLCMKCESSTQMYSKDIAWKPFFVCTGWTDKGDAICPQLKMAGALYDSQPNALVNI